MPVSFLSDEQRENYGRYTGAPSPHDLARYFHLDDADHSLIAQKRGEYNRLGFAVQLGTVRYLGTFLEDPLAVPALVLLTLAKQLRIEVVDGARAYSAGEQRWQHAAEIRSRYGYVEITERQVGFRLTRWLYALCWTGTDRPSVLFERAITWLVTHKVLLPGCSTLERYIARLRSRVEERLWRSLGRGISSEQQARLESLLTVPLGSRNSQLDRLRTGPVMVSSPSLVQALLRLHSVRALGIKLPAAARIPATRVAALARFAGAAKASAILRLPNPRRLATLVAFVHCLEATAQDDALEVLEALLRELFGDAVKADKKARLRTLKDLDQAAATLVSACQILLDTNLPDAELRTRLFEKIPRDMLTRALDGVTALIRPADNVYYQELDAKYKTVRRFLPALVEHIRFDANASGKPIVTALDWLRDNMGRKKPGDDAPREVVGKSWQRHVLREDGDVDFHAYTFCVLAELQTALKRRDVFVAPSWRYADPRAGLLDGAEWEGTRFWRIDPQADYGPLNAISAHHLSLQKIAPHWDDMLRLAGSLKLGRVPATGIMRTLQVGDRPTRLAQAVAEFGRIDKTLHTLTYIDDEAKRRSTLIQLNRGEGRHSVARAVFHGKRGELRQHYREGQEDQLDALGLVLNMIVLWNTIYIEAALNQLQAEGYSVRVEEVARLSPLLHGHINMLGRYSFSVSEAVAKGELRPLRNPSDEE